ncbi:hypothetical protein KUTeg_016826 [Tegillarca granosa]|uniref:Mab-21-like HhH/H2TH-like domain-containing protein n=1 Tax=Tegillarca granosa TaxID=220873 RepID=A0ABQ9EQX3_TEGGR|nr:hypothetical protein KUTeg_016826 [Tegillarca granosa]
MNQVQFLCYDLLCSYYLKTSVCYGIEDENIFWSAVNFLKCFWVCLRRLIGWVREGHCPNYSVKEKICLRDK